MEIMAAKLINPESIINSINFIAGNEIDFIN